MSYRIDAINCERTKTTVFIEMDEEGKLIRIRCPHIYKEGLYRCNLGIGGSYKESECLIVNTNWANLESKIDEIMKKEGKKK